MPFELRPGMPDAGLSASKDGLGHSERVGDYLLRVAREEGLPPMQLPDLVPKTHRAMVMSEVARDAGADVYRAAHAGIFLAHYGDGLDIGSEEVLLRVAGAVEGLDPAIVADAWRTGAMDERIEEFRHLALHLGITTTPSALICNEVLIGSRTYSVLAEAVSRCLLTPADAEEAGPPAGAPGAPKR